MGCACEAGIQQEGRVARTHLERLRATGEPCAGSFRPRDSQLSDRDPHHITVHVKPGSDGDTDCSTEHAKP